MTEGVHSPRVIRFGIFEVDLQSGELRKSGLKLKLTGQPFQVLAILLERPGDVVTREELQKRLWPDTFVDIDHNLNTAINKIREVLGDSAENPRFVETLPRRGYRFIAPVDGAGEKSAAAQPISAEHNKAGVESAPRIRKRWRVVAIAAGLIFCAALAFGIWLVLPTPQPRIVLSTQLTNDGKGKCCLVTDGSRVYFSESDNDGNSRSKYIPFTGGDPVTVPTPSLDTWTGTYIQDISPDHDRLLVKHPVSSMVFSFWIVPLSGSSPRPLTNLGEDVFSGGAWSPDGQRLVYGSPSGLFLARGDGTEPRKLATAQGIVSFPAWSPDGKFLRFVVSKEKPLPTSTFFEVSAERGEPHEVTPNWKEKAFEYFGRWTPDGRYFLFLSGHDGRANIWAIREGASFPWLRRRKPIQLTAGPVIYASIAFSPDGKKLFTRGLEFRGELERYTHKSAQFQPFLPGLSADCCVYSNDGKWIAYVTFPEGSLWRSRPDGSERQQLTWAPMSALNPHWSPDGKEIAFSGHLPGKMWKTFIIPAEGGETHQLTQNDCSELDAHWSPDGTHMTFAPFASIFPPSPSCPHVIYTMDLRTHETSTIPGSEGLFSPRWSPDGKKIVALTRDNKALMIYEITSRKWSELVRPGTPVGFPQWSTDGKLVYYGAGTIVYSIRIEDRKIERVADFSGIQITGNISGGWLAMTPDGSPLILRDVSLNEIYALDFEAP
jgi:Tol biopolymer transport system component/DNA-binding winged helix-turn-helix (wHTH) protein